MDLNKATRKDIIALQGVGQQLAERILDARPFQQLDDLLNIHGISSRLLGLLREQGVTVIPSDVIRKLIPINGTIKTEEKQPLYINVFDEQQQFLDRIQVNTDQPLNLPEQLIGKTLTLFVTPEFDLPDEPTIERLQRHGFAERRLKIPFERPELDLGEWFLPPPYIKMACCRVRGRVTKQITLPNGQTRTAPLCHARVEICEVDRSPRLLIAQLATDHVARFRRELIELGTPIDPINPTLTAHIGATTARMQQLRAISPSPQLAGLAQTLQTTQGIEATRATLLTQIDVLAPFFCHFEWLFYRYTLDCLKTIVLDANGNFDTDISYPCYGDKPDLYIRVQQKCHSGDDWTTVHAPSVACNTIWNYCCGDPINIVVTNPDAAIAAIPGGCSFPYMAGDPASIGEWSSLPDSEVFTVHAAVMNNGKVLIFSGGTEVQLPLESRVWDPITGGFTTQSFVDDLFCAHQIALADGRILVNGGSNYNGPHGRGIDASYTFNPLTETWTKHADMQHGRWYPTTVELPDGRALTFSGRRANNGIADEVEVFNPNTNTWSQLPASANKELEIYPTMHLLKNGNIFYSGCRWAGQTRTWASPDDTAVFNPNTNAWTDIGPHVLPNRTEGTSVLLPPARAMSMEGHEHGEELPPPPSDQRILVLGGVTNSVANRKSAEIIDLNDDSPAWVRITDMNFPRVNPNAVILPDRRVLVVGGVERYKFDWDPGAILTCELFDPTAETWTLAAIMNNPRHYHSIAVLLPDGRVMTTGTSSSSGNDVSMEIYSPPYLFRGPRPRITGYPATVGYDSMINVQTPDACRIRDACLVRPGAPTHHTDTEQRLVPLHIHHTHDCSVSLMIPNNPALLPPGYYLLFILDDCEIPSIGKFVHVS